PGIVPIERERLETSSLTKPFPSLPFQREAESFRNSTIPQCVRSSTGLTASFTKSFKIRARFTYSGSGTPPEGFPSLVRLAFDRGEALGRVVLHFSGKSFQRMCNSFSTAPSMYPCPRMQRPPFHADNSLQAHD